MLPSIAESVSQAVSLHSIYQIDDNRAEHQAEALPLASRIMTVARSNEPLISASSSEPASLAPDKQHNNAQCKGWFQRLFVGITAVASIGALATTGLHYARREGHGSQTGDVVRAGFLPVMDTPYFATQIHSSTPSSYLQMNHTLTPPSSSMTQENSTSEPYSYYKGIYDSQTKPINTTSRLPSSSKEHLNKNSSTPTPRELVAAENKFSAASLDAMNTFYKTLPKNITDDWKYHVYYAMQNFYQIEINNTLARANYKEPGDKCGFIADLLSKISKFKAEEEVIKKAVSYKHDISPCDHARLTVASRKIDALIAAAEIVIVRQETTDYKEDILNNKIRYHKGNRSQRTGAINRTLNNMNNKNSCSLTQEKAAVLKSYGDESIHCYF